MKMKIFLLFSLLFFSPCFAQLMPGPIIDDDNRITFSICAPEAQEVKVINLSDSAALGAAEYQMAVDADGKWSVTTKSCRAGLHYYELSIDGARVADPASPLYFGWGKWTSCVEVPDKELDFYLPRSVPHGDVRMHWYQSSTTATARKCLVYTPPEYDQNVTQRYPVLYLQHGAGESELGWTMQGKANFIFDNLIADGRAKPMLIVMDSGYAARPNAENPHRPRGDENVFAELLIQELIPMIDSQFRTLADRNHRAIAGLSMGGGQALRIGLTNPELFASVATFSGAGRFDPDTAFDGVFKDAVAFNSTYRLFFIGCGTLEGNRFTSMKELHELLTERGIRNAWSAPVGSHEWQVWRVHLYELAQLLFN
ncbi:esterase [candidate division KSB1 bacterium]|nr:esterase [candidate division KSB1 bacterium]